MREASRDEAVHYLDDCELTDMDRLTIILARKGRQSAERSMVYPKAAATYLASVLAQFSNVTKIYSMGSQKFSI